MCSTLTRAVLRVARKVCARLGRACLQGAEMRSAELRGAGLRRAGLGGEGRGRRHRGVDPFSNPRECRRLVGAKYLPRSRGGGCGPARKVVECAVAYEVVAKDGVDGAGHGTVPVVERPGPRVVGPVRAPGAAGVDVVDDLVLVVEALELVLERGGDLGPDDAGKVRPADRVEPAVHEPGELGELAAGSPGAQPQARQELVHQPVAAGAPRHPHRRPQVQDPHEDALDLLRLVSRVHVRVRVGLSPLACSCHGCPASCGLCSCSVGFTRGVSGPGGGDVPLRGLSRERTRILEIETEQQREPCGLRDPGTGRRDEENLKSNG